MARSIRISTARTMFNSGAPVDISVWKSDGSILELKTVSPCDTIFTEVGATSKSLPPASAERYATAASSASTAWKFFSNHLCIPLKITLFVA